MISRQGERDALVDALHATGSVRVPLARLWELWCRAAPRLVAAPDQAAGLAEALDLLAAADAVELPAGAWDRSTSPPLPRSLVVPAARRVLRTPAWKRRPWCPELGWVASLASLTDERFAELIAIDSWLRAHAGGSVPTVPVRYRSVELFGAEKRLEQLARSTLFAPGRLSLDLLACRHLPPPLAAVTVGDGTDVLVVENSDTYWVAVDAARRVGGRVGAVVWGSGNSFPSQVGALGVDVAGRGPATGTVWYWGDLDPAGVSIATQAASTAVRLGISVTPPMVLWAATATAMPQDVGAVAWPVSIDLSWFGELRAIFQPVVDAGARVAQESVRSAVIDDWMAHPA